MAHCYGQFRRLRVLRDWRRVKRGAVHDGGIDEALVDVGVWGIAIHGSGCICSNQVLMRDSGTVTVKPNIDLSVTWRVAVSAA